MDLIDPEPSLITVGFAVTRITEPPPWLTEDAVRNRSNRLLEGSRRRAHTSAGNIAIIVAVSANQMPFRKKPGLYIALDINGASNTPQITNVIANETMTPEVP
jgi:hypothetical protein